MQQAESDAGYLAQFATNDLFAGYQQREGLTHLQSAALRLTLALCLGEHPTIDLVDDVLDRVGRSICSHDAASVNDITELEAAIHDLHGPAVVELNPAATFALDTLDDMQLVLHRSVRLVSGGSSHARLTRRNSKSTSTRYGSCAIVLAADQVTLERLAVDPGTLSRTGSVQSVTLRVVEGCSTVINHCDLAGDVEVFGKAEIRQCAIHNYSDTAVEVRGQGAQVLVSGTTIDRPGSSSMYGVCALQAGVASLQGARNVVRTNIGGSDFMTFSGGQIDGVELGLIGAVTMQ